MFLVLCSYGSRVTCRGRSPAACVTMEPPAVTAMEQIELVKVRPLFEMCL